MSADAEDRPEPWPRAVKCTLAAAGFLVLLGVGSAGLSFYMHDTWGDRGTAGDFFGGHLSGFGNLASFFVVFAALLLQTRELALQRRALKLQRDEMQAQAAELKRGADEQRNVALALAASTRAQERLADLQRYQAERSALIGLREEIGGWTRQVASIVERWVIAVQAVKAPTSDRELARKMVEEYERDLNTTIVALESIDSLLVNLDADRREVDLAELARIRKAYINNRKWFAQVAEVVEPFDALERSSRNIIRRGEVTR